MTGSVGQPPETLALAAVLRLPATPPHSPQPEYALASLCTKLSSLSFALFWSGRCQLFLVILEEIVLVVLHMPVFLLFCKKSIRSFGIKSGFCCPSPRNRPCCAPRFCSVLGTGRPQPCRQIAQDSSTPPGPPGGGCGMGTLTPAPRSGWRCVRVAPYRRLPRLTSLATGTTSVSGGTHPNRRGYLFPGATCCPTRNPTRGSLPAPCRRLFCYFVALTPAQLSPA